MSHGQTDDTQYFGERKSGRQYRLEQRIKELVPVILVRRFPQFDLLKPERMSITQCQASDCMRQVTVKWQPLYIKGDKRFKSRKHAIEETSKALELITKPMRYHVAGELPYLREAVHI